jgi:hypothetical protein
MRMSSLIGEYVHVARSDDALDREAKDFVERYNRALETGSVDGLPLKNGGSPRLWRLRHLTLDEVTWLLDQGQNGTGAHRLALHAIALALVGVTELKDSDGNPATLEREPDPRRAGFVALSAASLELVLRDPGRKAQLDTIRDLGNRILGTELHPLNG